MAVAKGEPVPEDGVFLTNEEMKLLRVDLSGCLNDLELANEEAVHQASMKDQCNNNIKEKVSSFVKEIGDRKEALGACKEEISEWDKRYQRCRKYASDLEGGGFFKNRKVMFVVDALIFSGVVYAARNAE